MNRVVYKINDDFVNQINILSELNINESVPIEDTTSNNKMIVNKLCIGRDSQKKMYIETLLLEVLFVSNNKLHLRLPESHINFFNSIDDKCTELLSDLVNGETDFDMDKLCENIDNLDLTNIEFKSIISNDLKTNNENILKINIFSNTTIKQGNKLIDCSKIKVGDSVRLVLGLDYISLLIDTTNLIARTKLYCYLIDVSKKYIYNPEPREKIVNWEFSPDNKQDNKNIFIKTNTTEEDNFNINTEVNQNLNMETNNDFKQNILSPINESSDTINFDDDTSSIGESLKDIKTIDVDVDVNNEISVSENIKLLSSVINNEQENMQEGGNKENDIYINNNNTKNIKIKNNKTSQSNNKMTKTKTLEKKTPTNKKSTSKNKISIETNEPIEPIEPIESIKSNELIETNEINDNNNKVINLEKSEKKTKSGQNKKSQSKIETENEITKETKTSKKNSQKK